jgi:hypothetical protein
MIDLEGLSARGLSVEATDLWSISPWKIDVCLGKNGSGCPAAGCLLLPRIVLQKSKVATV